MCIRDSLNADTLKIVVLGLVAFAIGTFGGCMLGKLLCKLTHGKINPLIGSAGVSLSLIHIYRIVKFLYLIWQMRQN